MKIYINYLAKILKIARVALIKLPGHLSITNLYVAPLNNTYFIGKNENIARISENKIS